MVRIVAGTAGGIAIKTPEGEGTKPTLDRVKQPMFSMLFGEIPGRTVLDLFAGSGSLGLEALSRGAFHCTFNDFSSGCAKLIRDNAVTAGLDGKAEITSMDYRQALKSYSLKGKKFGLILLDPPYEMLCYEDVLKTISALKLSESGAIAVCEHSRKDILPDRAGNFVKFKEKGYGTVGLTLYREGESETVNE